ncbi:hypothetical protein Cni_G28893 [Canna indica]|uniref:Reverse transcriptase domain-containing protein n=1 Tax=Canna indica TaxID=4628 RepID=A0AAQ3QP60_9LILI|nr:hypothetical protein Cni_G28893 [Canna indica]
MNNMDRGKSPGKDGYIQEFFIANWETVKSNLKYELDVFHEKAIVPKGWNETVLVIIPKNESPSKILDFIPIALCNVLYKILAKLIANRLRPFLGKLISLEQTAFIPGRQIQDNILIVAEIIESIHKSKAKKPYLLMKLDLQKTYDRVNWEADYEVMKCMSFPDKMIKWIKGCLERVRYFCKINGEISNPFEAYKGIRQGDPLSPYLFILMEEIFTSIMRKYVEDERIIPFKLKEFNLSHLCFADDLIITIKGSMKSYKGMREALELYCNLTGQIINVDKLELYFPKGVTTEKKHKICNFFSMKEGSYPMSYLGAYLGPKRIEKAYQMKLYEKVVKRMELWAKNFISQARRAVLINTVINSLPVYNLMTSKVDEKIIHNVKKVLREFFWAGNKKKGANLISWSKVTDSRANGGLGIRDISIMKKAMLAKRVLPMLNDVNSCWNSLFKAKYGRYTLGGLVEKRKRLIFLKLV